MPYLGVTLAMVAVCFFFHAGIVVLVFLFGFRRYSDVLVAGDLVRKENDH